MSERTSPATDPTDPRYARRLPLDLSQPCWPWTGSRYTNGYGRLSDGKWRPVHRLAYLLHVGKIPSGWQIDHVCHTSAVERGACEGGQSCVHRVCWNPAHLEAVPSGVNSRRGNHPLFVAARTNTCKRGHDLSAPDAVYVEANGTRHCRTCIKVVRRERERRRRQQVESASSPDPVEHAEGAGQ